MSDQYLRKVGLLVTSGGSALDLSEFRIKFKVQAADTETPNTAWIRVHNLGPETAKRVQKEFQKVVLQAGYQNGSYGIIFDGTIKQFKRGRTTPETSYLDIFGADGDQMYNFAVANVSLAAGSTLQDRLKAIEKSTSAYDVRMGDTKGLTGGVLPRGKVMFGLARYQIGAVATTANMSWSVQNGVVQFTPRTGYQEGEIVMVNAKTGMIGIPEATNNGVEVKVLMNSKLRIGTRLQIDNKSINTPTVVEQGFPRYADFSFPASVTEDGVYRVLVLNHEGDTHGQEWETDITCLAIDPSTSPQQSVLAY